MVVDDGDIMANRTNLSDLPFCRLCVRTREPLTDPYELIFGLSALPFGLSIDTYKCAVLSLSFVSIFFSFIPISNLVAFNHESKVFFFPLLIITFFSDTLTSNNYCSFR